ncbi:hypothetical protein JTE90_010111 [Oedothorax gibbosus]|uniref:Protein kinase domain-containing protein n=1 Tax=Oedothorax gibbosus TaxID=931172 RepID=A0AAV6TQG3_9ARAC|nr:hypothetical protein JTE90_010111 [Oedothorax gibbosus]
MGGFGQVYLLRHKITKDEVAAKVVVRSGQVTTAEQDIWPNLDHPNILRLIEQHQYGEHNIFLGPVPPGCVKLNNILIGKHRAMLCDFGFMAQSKGLKNSSFAPPHVYRPPEASISKGAEAKIPDGKAVDLWEFGVMMLRLFTRFHSQVHGEDWKKTFHPVLRNAIKKKNFKNRIMFSYYEVDKNTTRAALNLIHAFLHRSPYNRISAKRAQKHPFFKDPVPKYFVPYPKDFSLWK